VAPADTLLILVSIDGWRWDYQQKAPVPHLQAVIDRGVQAEGLIPGYPSKTIPNHYSIATGLYPGHHGMIANVIRDPATGRVFRRTDRAAVTDPMWWGGDPFWNTVQRAGRIAATMFWPGSEAPVGGGQPRLWREFDSRVPAAARVDQVLAWLDLPLQDRPSFVTLYLDQVDELGHWYGPESPQVRQAILDADVQLGRLVDGLVQRGLFERTNLVVLSDHGMAPTSARQTIFVDDYVSLADVEIVDINPTLGVVPAPGKADAVYRALSLAHPRLDVFKRDDTPLHWYFRGQPRVPPITGVADEGWVVIRRADYVEYWKRSPEGGQHGYDPGVRSMRGLFVAAGPAFKAGRRVPAFENVDVYNVLAAAMGVEPSPNDGDPEVARSVLR
jgi:predicted AlkP superfamily pyrophosphatase or phosphodiesterase